MKPLLLLLPLLCTAVVRADPVFVSGGTLDINSPTTEFYEATGSTTVNVSPGAVLPGMTLLAPQVTANVSGGLIHPGILVSQGTLNVSGGDFVGQDSGQYASSGIFVSFGTANITGGTFVGGNAEQNSAQPGNGVVGSAGTWNGPPYVSVLNISGGTFIGGTGGTGYYGGTSGYSLETLGDTTVTGGRFLSPVAISTLAPGSFTKFVGTHLSYENGVLSGTLESGDPIHVQVLGYPGHAVVNATATEVTFSAATAVPEPTSLTVFGAIVGLGFAIRRLVRAEPGRAI
jgi:hypothetical protein